MWIVRHEVGRLAPQVCEVAAPAARHEYLLADLVGALEDYDIAAAIGGCHSTHQTSGTAADYENIGICHAGRITGGLDLNEAGDRFFAEFAHPFHQR